MWRTVASLSSPNQFTFTYLFRHARHSQRYMQWVSPPHPPALSSPITLTDAMVNGWLEVTDMGPAALYSCQDSGRQGGFVQYNSHARNASSGWGNDDYKIRWKLLSVSLFSRSVPLVNTHVPAKEALKQTWHSEYINTYTHTNRILESRLILEGVNQCQRDASTAITMNPHVSRT